MVVAILRHPVCVAAAVATALAVATQAEAACNIIPAAQTTFRGTLGSASRAFAGPGEVVELSLDASCHRASPGFLRESGDPIVTVVFKPPAGGARNVVVLASDCAALQAKRDACASRADVDRVSCVEVNRPGEPPSLERVDRRVLRFRFPDTDPLVGGPSDDLTLAGPAAMAVTTPRDPLPCELASQPCAARSGLVACVDRIFAEDGTCDANPGEPFSHFTALPPPNDYQAICTAPAPPCQPAVDRSIRLTIDAAGNLLVPMDWRGILVDRDAVPVARQLRARSDVEAFPGRGTPIFLPDPSVLRSFSPEGVPILPVFDPQSDLTDVAAFTLFGTADAPHTVLRIARRAATVGQCAGGAHQALPCLIASDCPGGTCGSATCFAGGADMGTPCASDADCAAGGECGPGLFDFSTRFFAGIGAILTTPFDVVALDPVPLDGLTQSESVNSFVLEEPITARDNDADGVPDTGDLDGDGDFNDHVVKLASRATGRVQPIGPAGAEGRAVVRIQQPPFSFPALAIENDVVAFLEPEAQQGGVDANGNGRVLETNLRAYRLGASSAIDLLAGVSFAADAAPLVAGRSVAVSGERVFFRRAEADGGPLVTERASAPPGGGAPNGPSELLVVSNDGRFLVFASAASNLVPGDTNQATDLFVRDRRLGTTERVVLERPDAPLADVFVLAISNDGRAIVLARGFDVLVHDRSTGTTELASQPPTLDGRVLTPLPAFYAGPTVSPQPISADGRYLTYFACYRDPLPVPGPVPAPSRGYLCANVVRDRTLGTTAIAAIVLEEVDFDLPPPINFFFSGSRPVISADGSAIASDTSGVVDRASGRLQRFGGLSEDGAVSISDDGRHVVFETYAPDLVPGDTNGSQDAFVRDTVTRRTTRVNLDSDGRQVVETPDAFRARRVRISGDGRFASFNLDSPDEFEPLPFVRDLLTGQTADFRFDGLLAERGRLFAATRRPPGSVHAEVMIERPDPAIADLSGDGDTEDALLAVLDASPAGANQVLALCPAEQVAVAAGTAAFLRPEGAGETPKLDLCPAGTPVAGGVDLNGDGDAGDAVVHLWRGGQVQNLRRPASAIAFDGSLIAALVPEKAQGNRDLNGDGDARDEAVQVNALGDGWRNLGHAADAVQVAGSVVAFLTPERTQGAGPLNGDGDVRDRVVHVFDAAADGGAGAIAATGQAAEEVVVGPTGLVAFRTLESSQGERLLDPRDPGPATRGVLQIYDPVTRQVINSGLAVVPCTLEACDRRVPYLVLRDTIRFLSFEADQGRDLNGDRDQEDLVVQVLNLRRVGAGAGAPARDRASAMAAMAEATTALAATTAGICTGDGEPCASDATCGDGTCFVPPGGCILDLGTLCDPAQPSCSPGSFCSPKPGAGGAATCQMVQSERCRNNDDCGAGAFCSDGGATFQRLGSPLAPRGGGGGAAFTGAGMCVENRGTACTAKSDCTPGEFCEGGTCRRDQGVCDTDADCSLGAICTSRLTVATVSDGDADELPDPLDNCPAVANVEQSDLDGDGLGDACDLQTCGNGIVETDEPCDDGNLEPRDGCDCSAPICFGGGAIERPRIALSRLGGAAGDDRLTFSGRLRLPPTVAANTSLRSLLASGLQIAIQDLGSGGAQTFDLTRRTAVVPAPEANGEACGRSDQWTARREIDGVTDRAGGFTYRNQSNALPTAGCAPGSARGLRRIEIVDRRASRGTIDFRVFAQRAALGTPAGPLRGTFVLGDRGVDGLAGRCASVGFAPPDCAAGREKHQLFCPPRR